MKFTKDARKNPECFRIGDFVQRVGILFHYSLCTYCRKSLTVFSAKREEVKSKIDRLLSKPVDFGKVDRNEPLPPKNSGSQELNGWNLQRINMFQKLLKVKTKVGQNGFHVIAYLIQIASAKENRYNTNEITVEELEVWKKKNLDLFYSV